MSSIRRICVFCGSSPGSDPAYVNGAQEMGRQLADRKIALVYGGGRVGLMGEIARTVLDAGGEVIGVIPNHLFERKLAFPGLLDLRVVDSMHERKALMGDLSDAFIALPGGLGTIEEFFEALTWAQLGLHQKPCGLLNTHGFYSAMLEFLDHAYQELFIEAEHRAMVLVDEDPGRLLERLSSYRPPNVDKAERALEKTHGAASSCCRPL